MSTAILPPRRQETPSQVIDVDLIDDEPIQPPARRRRVDIHSWTPVASSGSGGRRHVIIIDSDDDDVVATRPDNRTHRLRSPPPPPSRNSVPPVPRLPTTVRPHRQDVIRPNANPYLQTLSARLEGPGSTQAASDSATPAPSATGAPRSHHTPIMGLGGALLSRVSDELRQRRQQQRLARELEEQRREERMNRTLGADRHPGWWSLYGSVFPGTEDPLEAHDNNPFYALSFFARPFFGNEDGDVCHVQPRFTRPTYEVKYTHSDQRPAPGFTYDFDPAEKEREAARHRKVASGVLVLDESGEIEIEEASSSATSSSFTPDEEASTILICALCGDPLVLSGSGPSKLWALRCGHMLDGKCVDALMRPPVTPAPDLKSSDVVIDDPKVAETAVPHVVDRKGKGKATAVDDSPSTNDTINPMRSRLRPRKQALPATGRKTPAKQTNAVSAETIVKAKTRRRRNGKGKAKVSAPLVISEHTWKCPVMGCQRAHVSELLEGGEGHGGEVRWVHREGQGAVQVFA